MSFWKKVLGKDSQETTQEHIDISPSISSENEEPTVEGESESLIQLDSVSTEDPNELVDSSVPQIASTNGALRNQKNRSRQSKEGQLVDADNHSSPTGATADSNVEVPQEELIEEVESAETVALKARLETEKQEFLEDLSLLDGRILPQLKVPDWREELEFVKESYEPCDLSDHIVKVSKRRLTARQ